MSNDYREYEKLAMKSLVRIRQNDEDFLKNEVCGEVIAIYYYYTTTMSLFMLKKSTFFN